MVSRDFNEPIDTEPVLEFPAMLIRDAKKMAAALDENIWPVSAKLMLQLVALVEIQHKALEACTTLVQTQAAKAEVRDA